MSDLWRRLERLERHAAVRGSGEAARLEAEAAALRARVVAATATDAPWDSRTALAALREEEERRGRLAELDSRAEEVRAMARDRAVRALVYARLEARGTLSRSGADPRTKR